MIPPAYRSVTEGRVILEDYVSVNRKYNLPGVKLEEGAAVGAMSFVNIHLKDGRFMRAPCRYVKDRNQI